MAVILQYLFCAFLLPAVLSIGYHKCLRCQWDPEKKFEWRQTSPFSEEERFYINTPDCLDGFALQELCRAPVCFYGSKTLFRYDLTGERLNRTVYVRGCAPTHFCDVPSNKDETFECCEGHLCNSAPAVLSSTITWIVVLVSAWYMSFR